MVAERLVGGYDELELLGRLLEGHGVCGDARGRNVSVGVEIAITEDWGASAMVRVPSDRVSQLSAVISPWQGHEPAHVPIRSGIAGRYMYKLPLATPDA